MTTQSGRIGVTGEQIRAEQQQSRLRLALFNLPTRRQALILLVDALMFMGTL